MRDPVLDVSLLRFAAFTLPGGLPRLLAALVATAARVPAEVYNGDEDTPLAANDIGVSTFAQDIHALRRQADARHWAESQRERAALRSAERLQDHLEEGLLIVDALRLDELPRRELLQDQYGIGRAEAASLVLAARYGTAVVYLSPQGLASDVARREGICFVSVQAAVAA